MAADQFDDDMTIQPSIIGLIDSCHATLAELLEDVITSEGLTDNVGHRKILGDCERTAKPLYVNCDHQFALAAGGGTDAFIYIPP